MVRLYFKSSTKKLQAEWVILGISTDFLIKFSAPINLEWKMTISQ